MKSPRQRAPRTTARRWRALCVLGLLAGLLGMHGLAPGGGVPHHAHAQQTHTRQVHTPLTQGLQAGAPHAHAPGTRPQAVPYGHCGGGHVQHADATCASGAVGGGPVLPSLVTDPVPVAVREDALRADAVVDPDVARAPPSLAELQLLRI